MVYLKLNSEEKILIEKLKIKHLQIGENFYIPFEKLKLSMDYLSEKQKNKILNILNEKDRLVFNRNLKRLKKVLIIRNSNDLLKLLNF
jgi:hypothetical protein